MREEEEEEEEEEEIWTQLKLIGCKQDERKKNVTYIRHKHHYH
jgi:hypothetical protein